MRSKLNRCWNGRSRSFMSYVGQAVSRELTPVSVVGFGWRVLMECRFDGSFWPIFIVCLHVQVVYVHSSRRRKRVPLCQPARCVLRGTVYASTCPCGWPERHTVTFYITKKILSHFLLNTSSQLYFYLCDSCALLSQAGVAFFLCLCLSVCLPVCLSLSVCLFAQKN